MEAQCLLERMRLGRPYDAIVGLRERARVQEHRVNIVPAIYQLSGKIRGEYLRSA